MNNVLITKSAASSQPAARPLFWGAASARRTAYRQSHTIDFDANEDLQQESDPLEDAIPSGPGKKKKNWQTPMATCGWAKKTKCTNKKKQTKKKGGGGGKKSCRPKRFYVRNGKVRVWSAAAGGSRSFSVNKIMLAISPNVIEAAADRVYRGKS